MTTNPIDDLATNRYKSGGACLPDHIRDPGVHYFRYPRPPDCREQCVAGKARGSQPIASGAHQDLGQCTCLSWEDPCYNFKVICEVARQFPNPENAMKHHRNVPTAFVLCAVCFVFITTPAYAYVDPNAAGLASQILTPLLLAVSVGVTFLRKQIGAAFGVLTRRVRRRTDA